MTQLKVLALVVAVLAVAGYGIFGPPQWLRPAPPPCGSAESGGATRCLSEWATQNLYDNRLAEDGCPEPIFYWNGHFVDQKPVCERS
jgi:hypothetical protein